MRFENAIYKAIVGECERLEAEDRLDDNAHHLAKRLAVMAAKGLNESYVKWVNNDIDKLREAQRAVDLLPDGDMKDALIFVVSQWTHAAFISHEPLTVREREWGESVVARLKDTSEA